MGYWKFFRNLLAIAVPVLAALITFLNFDARSAQHHHAGARFSALKRRLGLAIARRGTESTSPEITRATLEEACKEWNSLTESTPALYQKDWKKFVARSERELGQNNLSSAMTRPA